jgi:hypothetical protein
MYELFSNLVEKEPFIYLMNILHSKTAFFLNLYLFYSPEKELDQYI